VSRRNPAVTNPAGAAKTFTSIAQALEAETLQGTTAQKVANAAKQLVVQTGINAGQILQGLGPDTENAVRTYFQEAK
jgi:importin-5